MSFLKALPKPFIDLFTAPAEDMQSLRERILKIILVVASILGAVTLLINLNNVVDSQDWMIAGAYILGYLLVLFITLYPAGPYGFRAGLLIVITYILGVMGVAQRGIVGDGLTWMFMAAVLASLLFGFRWALSIWALDVISLIWVSFLFTTNRLEGYGIAEFQTTAFWLEILIDFVLLGGVATGAMAFLLNGLEKSLNATQNLSLSLEREHDRLEQRALDLEHRLVQIRTATEISNTISGNFELDSMLQQIVDLISERLNLDYVGLFVTKQKDHFARLRAGSGETGRILKSQGYQVEVDENTLAGWALLHGEPRIVSEMKHELDPLKNTDQSRTHSALALPLKLSQKVMGVLVAYSTQPEAFHEDDLPVFQDIAERITAEIENARIIQEKQQELDELNTLFNASRTIVSNTQFEEILRVVAAEIISLAKVDGCTISHWDRQQNEVMTVFDYDPGPMRSPDQPGTRYPLENFPLTSRVLEEGEIVQVRANDPQADPAEVKLMEESGGQSLIMFPLIKSDRVIGLLEVYDFQEAREFSPQQVRMVESLSTHVADAMDNNRILEQAQQLARRERIINQITSTIQQTVDVESILTTTITQLSKTLNIEEATIRLGTETDLLNSIEQDGENGQESAT